MRGEFRGGRRPRLGVALSLVLAGLLTFLFAPTISAHEDHPSDPTPTQTSGPQTFDVVEIPGLIDEIVADFIEDSIDLAADRNSGGLILQVDSAGHVVSDQRLAEVAQAIANSHVPVYAWVGPSGAQALGGAAQIVGATSEFAVAFGARLGRAGDLIFPHLLSPEFVAAAERLSNDFVGQQGAIDLGIAHREAPTLLFFLLDLPGLSSTIDTTADPAVRVPESPVRFSKLPLIDGWVHSLASPAMAYLLFLIGAALLIFEFYTAGVGIAGVLGAGCFVVGCYGFGVLPTRPFAIALLVVAMLGYAIDVQVGVPRVWSAIATIASLAGALLLYDSLALSWITMLVGVVGVALLTIAGLPSMVRSRFGTPTIGREWMVGKLATATEEIRKEGVVDVDGAPWRARVNRTTPIGAGDSVRIVAIEGLYLEIEPEEGGARDYRDMRKKANKEEAKDEVGDAGKDAAKDAVRDEVKGEVENTVKDEVRDEVGDAGKDAAMNELKDETG